MAWPEGLTTTQQALVQNWVDQMFRPGTLKLVTAMAFAATGTLPAYLASPTGLASTFASPAADSIAGLLATMSTADVVPLSAAFPNGYALALPLTVGEVITYVGGLNALVNTNYSAAALQAFSNIIGAPNL